MAIKLVAILSALIVAAGLLAACGGGGDDGETTDTVAAETTTTTETALSKDEILAQGDAICAEVNAAIGGLEATGATPAIQLSQRTDLYTGMVERLRGLDSADPGLTNVFSAGRDLVQAAAEAEEAAAAGDTQATVAAETTVSATLSAFEQAASSYGFSECGGEATAPPSSEVTGGEVDSPSETTPEAAPTPDPSAPSPPQDTGAAGGAPPTGTENDGGAAGGTGGGGDGGGGDGSSTGGFSPGG